MPTETLAEQHFATLERLLAGRASPSVALLTGSTPSMLLVVFVTGKGSWSWLHARADRAGRPLARACARGGRRA